MIIHQPEIIFKDEHAIVYTKMELEKPRDGFPEFVWYRVPDRYAEYITLRSDTFFITGIMPGMSFGEDIEVRGPVSPRLVYHLEEYQSILNNTFPDDLRIVNIQIDQVESMEIKPEEVSATFSGGVDSMFTLWNHLPENQRIPGFRISKCIFLHGFDLSNQRREKYNNLFSTFKESLNELNIELIPIQTNLVSTIIPRINFAYFYSPILASCAHLLGKLFRLFYIPSSWDYHQLKKHKHVSTSLADSFLSTEIMEVIHYGAGYSRVEKIEEISAWEFAHQNLRVCNEPDTTWNCSRCEKCTRTMVPLYALNRLEDFRTFAKPFKSDREVLWWARKLNPSIGYVGEIFPFVKQQKPEIFHWIILAGLIGYIRYFLVTFIPNPIKNWLRRYGFYVSRKDEPDYYEIPEIIQLLRGMNDRTPA